MPRGLPIGQMVDPYHVLGVPPEASEAAIRAAYRRLARALHPDVNRAPDAAARMREINAAYALLRDPAGRAAFAAPRSRPPAPDYPRVAGMWERVPDPPSAARPIPAAGRWWGWAAGPAPASAPAAVMLGPLQPRIVTTLLVAGFGVLVAVLAAWALLVIDPFGSAPRAPSSTVSVPAGRVAVIGGPGAPAATATALGARPPVPVEVPVHGGPAASTLAAAGSAARDSTASLPEQPSAALALPAAGPAPGEPASDNPGMRAAVPRPAPAQPPLSGREAPQPGAPGQAVAQPALASQITSVPARPATAVPQTSMQAVAAQQLAGAPSVATLERALSAFDRSWAAYASALRAAAAGELDARAGRASVALRGGGAALLSSSSRLGLARALYLDAELTWNRQLGATLAALPPAAGENGEARPAGGLQAQADLRLGQAASLFEQAQAMGTVSSFSGQVSALLDEADRLHAAYVAAWARYLAQLPA